MSAAAVIGDWSDSANVWAAEDVPESPEIEAELQQLKDKVAPKEPAKIESDTES